MAFLSKETADTIGDASDTESRDQKTKKMNDIQQMNNYSKNMVVL